MTICPLCGEHKKIKTMEGPGHRIYFMCEYCHLIFTESRSHPSPGEEKSRYLKHQNNIDDPGYITFLNKAITPALKYIKPDSAGLDYGCGPAPALSFLMEKQGFTCDNYDPFFFPELKKNKLYDFIFSVESAEHFFYPGNEFGKITCSLKPGGFLILMTQLWEDENKFKNWWYARDNTHVSFYHRQTIDYICRKFKLEMIYSDVISVFIFRRLSDVTKYI